MKKIGIFSLLILLLSCSDEQDIDKSISSTSDLRKGRMSKISMVGSHRYYLFYRGKDHSNIRYAYSEDGTNWTGVVELTATTGLGCSAIIFDNKIIVANPSVNNRVSISYSYDGLNWVYTETMVSLSGGIPSLSVESNILKLYFSDPSGGLKMMESVDAVNWATPVFVNDNLGQHIPVYSSIHVDNGEIFFNQLDGGINKGLTNTQTFPSTVRRVTDAGTTNCAGKFNSHGGATSANGLVAMASFSTNKITLLKRSGCGWSKNVRNQASLWRPSITYNQFLGKYTVVFRKHDSNYIYYIESTDGVTWSNQALAYGQTNYAPFILSQ